MEVEPTFGGKTHFWRSNKVEFDRSTVFDRLTAVFWHQGWQIREARKLGVVKWKALSASTYIFNANLFNKSMVNPTELDGIEHLNLWKKSLKGQLLKSYKVY